MNYYGPNYYQNPYNTTGSYQYVSPSQTAYPQTTPMVQPVPAQNAIPAPGLNGKLVDSADVVKATEVPIGGYGIFPKADLSEIYVKSWNNDGTTNLVTFKPIIPPVETVAVESQQMIDINAILDKISILENKLDAVLNAEKTVIKPIRKELSANDY